MSTLKDLLVKKAYRTQSSSGWSHNTGYPYGDPYGSPYGGLGYNHSTTYLDPSLDEIRGGQSQWMNMSPEEREAYVRPDHVAGGTVGGALLGGMGGAALGGLGGALLKHPGTGAAIGGTLGAIGGGYLGHGAGVEQAREQAQDPEIPDEYAYELARKHMINEMLKAKAPDATIQPVGEPVSVSEAKQASLAASPAISNIVNRARQAGLHKVAAQLHSTPVFTLKIAAQILGTKLVEQNARYAKIAQGLAAFDAVTPDDSFF